MRLIARRPFERDFQIRNPKYMNIPSTPSNNDWLPSADSQNRALISEKDEIFDLSAADFRPETSKSTATRAVFDKSFHDLINDAVVIFDPVTDLILSTNEKTAQSYQISDSNLLNVRYRALWEDPAEEKTFVETLLQTGSVKDFKASHRRADRSLIDVQINAALIEYDGRQTVIAINHNVTEWLAIE